MSGHIAENREYITKIVESQMEQAFADGEFKVYFQPKVNMVTDKLAGAEALSRWVRPGEGVRMPDMYIPVMENNGYISKLDLYMFEETCKAKASFVGRPCEHVVVSVNMSRIHLYNENFPDALASIADKYGVPHSELEIEVTESAYFDDAKEMIQRIKDIQNKGFPVSIDDFGSGYSALNMLKDMTVDAVKLDLVFLKDSYDSKKGKTVLRSVISMCRDLKMEVICEGVEKKEQVDLLVKCGCQVAQGFYYSKAVPLEDFVIFADEHMTNVHNSCTFHFDGNLDSDVEGISAGFVREGKTYSTAEKALGSAKRSKDAEYVDGIFEGKRALYLPGGRQESNVAEINPDVIANDSYTVAFWIKTERNIPWSSVIYIKFETGFASFNPAAWEGHSSYRIRDSREVNGWYDTSTFQLEEGVWWHVVLTYNAQKDQATLFINGDVASVSEDVRTNRYVKRVVIGGDVFQPSYNGAVCELIFYNEAVDYDFVSKLFESYISREDFAGEPLKRLV